MRVHVDEARGDELAARVDLLGALGKVPADRRDLAVDHREVRFNGVSTSPIDDGAVANHKAGRGHADAPIEGEHRIGMGAPVANDSRAWLDRALRLFEDRHPSAARPSARHLGIEGDAASKEKP
jgi:hypothetical protein